MRSGNRKFNSYNLLDFADDPEVSSYLVAVQRRITELLDFRLIGSDYENDIIHLYSTRNHESNTRILDSDAFNHTMFESIDKYCGQKLPVQVIETCIQKGYTFEVLGVFPEHFSEVCKRLGYKRIKKVRFVSNTRPKKFNYIRPAFYKAVNSNDRPVFIVAAGAGRDYVFHYASMLRHVLASLNGRHSELHAYTFPYAEASIHVWTELDDKLVSDGDSVLLGYVEEIQNRISHDERFKIIGTTSNAYYTSTRYQNVNNGRVVNLLGVKFSFWGSISAKIVGQICRLGAREIIYAGKLGTLTSPNDIYQRIFIPSQYLVMYHDKIVGRLDHVPNGMLKFYPKLSTRRHVSVPTVVEEDYVQRAIVDKMKINSIDNEISQMACAVAAFNRELNKTVAFSAVHIATDYIRRHNENKLKVKYDLSNNRALDAFKLKQSLLDEVAEKIFHYLDKSDTISR